MDFTRPTFYAAPFPSDDLRGADGTIDLSRLPDPDMPALMEQARALLASADGFARTGAIYLRATGAIDPTSLPDLAGSIAADASVFVVPLVAQGFVQTTLVKQPVGVAYLPDGGPYGDKNLLAILPLQGAALLPQSRYAAIVTTRVRDAKGHALVPSLAMTDLVHGYVSGPYKDALATVAGLGVDPSTIAGIAVFTTGGDPSNAVFAATRATHVTVAISAPALAQAYPDFCVYQASVQMPVLQQGTPPYTNDGGGWADPPNVDHYETARVFVTIPHATMPAAGWPTVVFVRTGGGGDNPLVERGVCATADFTQPITPGTGPAREFARVGFAGIQVDGPLGGARNPTGADEEFLIFNVQNAAALRDNIRQSAVELAWLPDAIGALTFDTSACTGASATASFDLGHLALMGHSMGAWIAPLAAAIEPRFGAVILSGAGGSFIANVIDKQKPIAPEVVVASLLDLPRHGDTPTYFDPALTILQWAAEPADPQAYFFGGNALMLQGIVDHYILPTIAEATILSESLDAAGPLYDAGNAELQQLGQPALAPLLQIVGAHVLALPAGGNATVGGTFTRLVVQHPGDGIEDGHEVIFQTEAPKHQYRCFLASWLAGTGAAPTVPADGAADDPCP